MTNRLCYVCEGGDCTEKGSGDVFDKLRDLIKQFDPNQERIKIRRYPCFGACDQGINVTLYPDKIFYSKVTEADLAEIAAHIAPARFAAGFATAERALDTARLAGSLRRAVADSPGHR